MRMYVFIMTVDVCPLGRFDVNSLDDQTKMQFLFSGFINQWGLVNAYGEIQNLLHIRGIKTDKNGNVLEINLSNKQLGGLLDMQWFPPLTEKIEMHNNDVNGVLDVSLLPCETRFATFGWNNLTGSLNLAMLSKSIQILGASNNYLTGTIEFHAIPKNLVSLDLSCNQLSGNINLSLVRKKILYESGFVADSLWENQNFPDEKVYLSLGNNDFDGDILVERVDQVHDKKAFQPLNCQHIVDPKGNKGTI